VGGKSSNLKGLEVFWGFNVILFINKLKINIDFLLTHSVLWEQAEMFLLQHIYQMAVCHSAFQDVEL